MPTTTTTTRKPRAKKIETVVATTPAVVEAPAPKELTREDLRIGIAYPFFMGSFARFYPGIRVVEDPTDVVNFDLIVFAGGEDLSPSMYGEENTMSFEPNAKRDAIESEIFKACRTAGVHVYGSCRGHQLINVLCGGSLHQDIISSGNRHGNTHELNWEQNSMVGDMFSDGVNSLHHQGIHNLGKDLYTLASFNGIPEVIYGKKMFGTQFHPELMRTQGAIDFFNLLLDWVLSDKKKEASAS